MPINKDAKLIKDLKKAEQIPPRNGFGDALLELGKTDPKVVALCGDLVESTRVEKFAKAFPSRFFEMGVAEQNMAGVAAGLALEGFTAFASSYATFNPGRNWDQIRVSVCYNRANVKIVGAHAGISVGPDGATHQALEDIASTRCLPNLTVEVPCDYWECYKTTVALAAMKGPAYFRFGRAETPIFTTKTSPFKIGRIETLRDGNDLTIIGAGPILYDALLAAEELKKEKGWEIRVLNCHTIKPIDQKMIIKAAKETGGFVTVEEHQTMGGVGSAIMEVLAQNFPIPVEMIGMPNSFGESGEPKELLNKYGMSVAAIKAKVLQLKKRMS
ncbi:MAG: transketolase C-terminal domain-containing protein [Janthinobacterium sp.]